MVCSVDDSSPLLFAIPLVAADGLLLYFLRVPVERDLRGMPFLGSTVYLFLYKIDPCMQEQKKDLLEWNSSGFLDLVDSYLRIIALQFHSNLLHFYVFLI